MQAKPWMARAYFFCKRSVAWPSWPHRNKAHRVPKNGWSPFRMPVQHSEFTSHCPLPLGQCSIKRKPAAWPYSCADINPAWCAPIVPSFFEANIHRGKTVLNGLYHIYYWENSNSSPATALQRAA